jgi:hypothetical protein
VPSRIGADSGISVIPATDATPALVQVRDQSLIVADAMELLVEGHLAAGTRSSAASTCAARSGSTARN